MCKLYKQVQWLIIFQVQTFILALVSLNNDKLLNLSLDFYLGSSLAIDSITSYGIPVQMNVFDINNSSEADIYEIINNYEIKMIVEPGRFIAAPAVKLVTKVLRIYDNNIIVDASVYNSDMDALIVPVKLLVEGELKKGEGEAYVIKGVTPCSMDLFRYRVYLKDLKEGDEIVFLNAGAYNFSTEFCDLEKIEVETIE